MMMAQIPLTLFHYPYQPLLLTGPLHGIPCTFSIQIKIGIILQDVVVLFTVSIF